MKLGSKEHYEAVEMFDRIVKSSPSMRFRLDKEPKTIWSTGSVYQDGSANMAFNAFLHGVAFGKAISQGMVKPSRNDGQD